MEKEGNINNIENEKIAKTAEPLIINDVETTPTVQEPMVINSQETTPTVQETMVINSQETTPTVQEPMVINSQETTPTVQEPTSVDNPPIDNEKIETTNTQKNQKGSIFPKIIIFILIIGAILAIVFFLGNNKKDKKEENKNEQEEIEEKIEKIILDENMNIDYESNIITMINSAIEFDPGNRKLFSVTKDAKFSILLVELYSAVKSYDLKDDILYYSDKEYNLYTYNFNTKENKNMELKLVEGFWNLSYISKDKIGVFADKDNKYSFRVYDLNNKKETLYDIEVGFLTYMFKDNSLYYVTPKNELHKLNLDSKKDELLLDNIVINRFTNDKAIYQKKDDFGYFAYELETKKDKELIKEQNSNEVSFIFEVKALNNFYYIKNNNQIVRNYKEKDYVIYETPEDTYIKPYLTFDKFIIFDTYKKENSCSENETCAPKEIKENRYILDLEKNTYKTFNFVYEHPTN